MSTKAARGTKRTCQSSSCGARFYDLARDPITCPICGSTYVVAVAAISAAALAAARKAPVAPPPDFDLADGPKAEDGAEAVPEEALADIEGGDEPVVVADDETFLEEEEDGGSDVSGLVGGGGEEPEEG